MPKASSDNQERGQRRVVGIFYLFEMRIPLFDDLKSQACQAGENSKKLYGSSKSRS